MRRLSVRLGLNFLFLALLAALAVGLPAIWLSSRELNRQAESQAEQGRRSVLSLLDKQYLELEKNAILTAQRPTLNSLLNENNLTGLEEYLGLLQNGTNLDLINLCLETDTLVGTRIEIPACRESGFRNFYLGQEPDDQQAWMFARTDLNREQVSVAVGIKIDQDLISELSLQTGMELALLSQDLILNTLNGPEAELVIPLEDCLSGDLQDTPTNCVLAGTSYLMTETSLGESGWLLVAFDLTPLQQAQKEMVYSMAGAIFIVAAAGSILGGLLSRLVSHPLEELSGAAAAFSQGDLDTRFSSRTRVQEISRVAEALEDAREKLTRSLTSLENEKEWSENLLASIVDGIITLDGSGRVIFFSQGAERLTGIQAEDAAGSRINDILKLTGSEGSFLEQFSGSSAGYQRLDITLPDGREMTCAITSAQLNRVDNHLKGEKALVIRDISEEEAVHRLLGHFIANVAHELLTPLTAVEASIEMLQDQSLQFNKVEIRELHNSIHLGILGLHTLVNNLLESANIEARRFRISPRSADLSAMVGEAVQTMRPLLSKYDQRLVVEISGKLPVVKADHRRIVQVLVNLISNASRYGPPDEEIKITVRLKSDQVRIAVWDRGPGIPLENRKNLFLRFEFPHDQQSISQAGAGLGLSVVKAIVLAHGGDVGVEDRPEGGSIFWFSLPKAKEE